jgi:antirestriction protein ArdC
MTPNEKIEIERQALADAVLSQIENGNLEWTKGWHCLNENSFNAKTEKEYQGTNLVILYLKSMQRGYQDPRWLTFNQAKDLGAAVKKGEQATTIFHWNEYDKATGKVPNWEEINKMPITERQEYKRKNIRYSIAYHNVFNAAQVDGLASYSVKIMSADEQAKQNAVIEQVISASQAPVLYDGGSQAFYDLTADKIHLPEITAFKTKNDYYATALHEIGHSTGHESRLFRKMTGQQDKAYAIEELRAEFASLFLQAELGITLDGNHFENHSAYVQSWAEAIKSDKSVLFGAIKDAGDIASWVKENYAEKNKKGEKVMDEWEDGNIVMQENGADDGDYDDQIDIKPLSVKRSTEKAVLVQLEIAGADKPKDTWFPKSQVTLDEEGKNVIAVNEYLQKKYGKILSKQEEIAADRVGKRTDQFDYKYDYDEKNDRTQVGIALGQPVYVSGRISASPTAYEIMLINETINAANEVLREDKKLSGLELVKKINADRLNAIEKNTPAEMKELPNWCVLKLYKDKEADPPAYKKFIVNANNPAGGWASHKDPTNWTTFDKALEYARSNGGAGLSFAIKGSGFNAFDLDHCYDKETQTFNDTAKKFLEQLPDSYAEKSVSGTGLHIFTKSQICENGKFNEARGDSAPIEVFENWGFVSMTGNIVDEKHKNLTALPEGLKTEIQNQIGEKKQAAKPSKWHTTNIAHNESEQEIIDKIDRSRKGDEFRQMMSGANLCGDHSRTDFKMMNILAYFSHSNQSQMESIFRSSGLYRKEKGDDYIRRTAEKAIKTLASQKDR